MRRSFQKAISDNKNLIPNRMNIKDLSNYQFEPETSGWSKTDKDGNPGLSIFEHCRHVGWVAFEIINQGKRIPHTEIGSAVASIVAAMHDVGKWSPGFLQMCPVWLKREKLEQHADRNAWAVQQSIRHEKNSQDSIQLLLQKRQFTQSEAVSWAMIAGAHHGKLHAPIKYGRGDLDRFIDIWHDQRFKIVEALEKGFGATIHQIGIKKTDPIVLWLMGLTSVADWIGSDENHFPADQGWNEDEAKQSAKMAVESIGLVKPEIRTGLSFQEIFGFKANDMQHKAISAISKPGIYVIEAPMGMGKTEAALACTYGLLQSGQATGLYFALPTQLTSNRIHLRVSEFIEKITINSSKTRLAHANAWLEDGYYQPRPVRTLVKRIDNDASMSRDWFASAKRALLANFGVGTVDQALMSVVAVKHFFVRRFALAGKVIIVDEVHSYDHFTGTLVRLLCQELQKLGCTIIILSATLLPDVRNELIGVQEGEIKEESYPLITGKITIGDLIPAQVAKPPLRPAVKRMFKSTQKALFDASYYAKRGARVLWVCNTVNSAQDIFHKFSQIKNGFEIGILHSRFPHFIRQRQEEYWMERLGKTNRADIGCILVSTQIVEQSVDIDSDILISELAPMDMLLQRLGRLWRHLDDRPANIRPADKPELWIIQEEKSLNELEQIDGEKIKEILGAKAKVYQPYVLLKTYETLSQECCDFINLANNAGNSDIRNLLNSTYHTRDDEPDTWKNLAGELKGSAFAEKQLAIANTHLFAKAVLNDEEGKQTRLIEIETIPMLIATEIGKDLITLLNGDSIPVNIDDFNIRHARSIHSNIVRVHSWPFDLKDVNSHQAVSFYLKQEHCLSLLDENGQLEIKGLKDGISFEWDATMGVVQTHGKGGINESCD